MNTSNTMKTPDPKHTPKPEFKKDSENEWQQPDYLKWIEYYQPSVNLQLKELDLGQRQRLLEALELVKTTFEDKKMQRLHNYYQHRFEIRRRNIDVWKNFLEGAGSTVDLFPSGTQEIVEKDVTWRIYRAFLRTALSLRRALNKFQTNLNEKKINQVVGK